MGNSPSEKEAAAANQAKRAHLDGDAERWRRYCEDFAREAALSKTKAEANIQTLQTRLSSADPEERFRLYCEIADLYVSVQSDGEAVHAYLAAHALKPEDFGQTRTHRLLDLITKTEQWMLFVDFQVREAAREKDGGRRGKFSYSAGVIYRGTLVAARLLGGTHGEMHVYSSYASLK